MRSVDAVVTRLSRAQSRQQTRDRLVSAAMRVFARDGYAGASVNAIAEQAGYTVGALYSNFATKEDLFLAAFEQHCADELAALEALVASSASWQELIAAVTERFCRPGPAAPRVVAAVGRAVALRAAAP